MTVQKQIDQLLTYRASEWLEAMISRRVEEYPGFIQWVTESPRHLDEFLRLFALSQQARYAARHGHFDLQTLLQRVTPDEVVELRSTSAEPVRLPGARRKAFWQWPVGLAAAIALISLAALWVQQSLSPWKTFATNVAEQRTVELADGSVVYLNAQSTLEVRLGTKARDIHLLQGDALFKVAHDTQRPFRVATRDAVVQAVGTQFNVSAREDGTRVAVLEGKVQVSTEWDSANAPTFSSGSATPASAPVPTPLKAGEAARISPAGAIEQTSRADVSNAIAWRQRRLVFEKTPLEEVVQEFNRFHRSMRLHLEGVEAGSHHYSGTFDADDPESFAELLSRERDLTVERRDGDIIIRARP